jgi:hypothetical protein
LAQEVSAKSPNGVARKPVTHSEAVLLVAEGIVESPTDAAMTYAREPEPDAA